MAKHENPITGLMFLWHESTVNCRTINFVKSVTIVQIFNNVWVVDHVAKLVENHRGKERLQTTQSHLPTQCLHPQPEVDRTQQLTLLPENIGTSYLQS